MKTNHQKILSYLLEHEGEFVNPNVIRKHYKFKTWKFNAAIKELLSQLLIVDDDQGFIKITSGGRLSLKYSQVPIRNFVPDKISRCITYFVDPRQLNAGTSIEELPKFTKQV